MRRYVTMARPKACEAAKAVLHDPARSKKAMTAAGRHLTQPTRAGYYDDAAEAFVEHPHITVFEADNEPFRTGLLDANGADIYAVDEREPIGFRLR